MFRCKCFFCIALFTVVGCSTIGVGDRDRTENKAFNGSWAGDFESVSEIQITYDMAGNGKQYRCKSIVGGIRASVANDSLRGSFIYRQWYLFHRT